MYLLRLILAGTTSALALCCIGSAAAQNPLGNRVNWIGPGGVEAAWDAGDMGGGEGANWQSASLPPENFQPDGSFGEYASISSFGTPGIALIDNVINVSPTDVILGQDGGTSGTLVVRDGGSITVQGSGGVGNGELINGLAGSGRLVLQDNMGTVQLSGFRQRSTSTLVTRLSATGTFANRVQVSQGVNLAGTLLVEAAPGSGFTLTTGNSWTIMQGAPVTGNFTNVQVTPTLLSNAGQTFAVATAGNAVTLSVVQRLVLQVDRFTGATALINPAGHSSNIELIGYTLSSSAGNLASSDSRWSSFQDDPSKPGWFEANPTASNLSELNPTGSLTLTAGQCHNFGAPLNVNAAAPLGVDRVATGGLSFRYQLPSGELIDAAVNVSGRFNDLALVVNPTLGSATIQNQSAQNLEFLSYTISSASGSLLTSWNSLQDQNVANWFEANPTANNLSELNTTGSATMNVGAELNLGTVWNAAAGLQDLVFRYQTLDGVLRQGTVFFGAKAVIPGELPGDYDGNGVVNHNDLLAWKAEFGSTPAPGTGADGDGDGDVDGADFLTWQRNLGSAVPSAPGTVASSAPVPEPGSMWPASCVIASMAVRSRKKVVMSSAGRKRASCADARA